MDIIVEVITNFVEVGLFFYFIFRVMHPNNQMISKVKYIVPLWIFGIVSWVSMLNYFKIDAVFSMPTFIFLQFMFIKKCMDGNLTQKWTNVYIFTLIDLTADCITLAFLDVFLPVTSQELFSEYPQRYLLIGGYLFLLTSLTMIFTREVEKGFMLPKRVLIIFTTIITGFVIIVQGMAWFGIYSMSKYTNVIYGIMLVTLVMVVLALISMIIFGKLNAQFHFYGESQIPYSYEKNGVAFIIDLKKVKIINSDLRQTKIVMENGTEHSFYKKLDIVINEIVELYPFFLRVNKSLIFSKSKIDKMNDKEVYVDGQPIRISRKFYKDYSEKFLQGAG